MRPSIKVANFFEHPKSRSNATTATGSVADTMAPNKMHAIHDHSVYMNLCERDVECCGVHHDMCSETLKCLLLPSTSRNSKSDIACAQAAKRLR